VCEIDLEIPGGVLIKCLDGFYDLIKHVLCIEQGTSQASKRGQHIIFHLIKEFIRTLADPILVKGLDPIAHL
jgi:hypothetical protein